MKLKQAMFKKRFYLLILLSSPPLSIRWKTAIRLTRDAFMLRVSLTERR